MEKFTLGPLLWTGFSTVILNHKHFLLDHYLQYTVKNDKLT